MNDINIHENSLLLAYMMKRVAAYYRVNKSKDQLAQSIATILEGEAKSIETETLTDIRKC